MSDKITVYLKTDVQRKTAHQYIDRAPADWMMKLTPPSRTLEQNAKMWPMLADIVKQVTWDGEKMTDEEWKDWFTAALKKQRMVRGMYGGIVFVGSSTSKMSKVLFSDLIELMYAFGAQQNVVWSEPALRAYDDLRRAA